MTMIIYVKRNGRVYGELGKGIPLDTKMVDIIEFAKDCSYGCSVSELVTQREEFDNEFGKEAEGAIQEEIRRYIKGIY